eukprot:4750803-Pleurochrysis_carterae.AAC.1
MDSAPILVAEGDAKGQLPKWRQWTGCHCGAVVQWCSHLVDDPRQRATCRARRLELLRSVCSQVQMNADPQVARKLTQH